MNIFYKKLEHKNIALLVKKLLILLEEKEDFSKFSNFLDPVWWNYVQLDQREIVYKMS